MRRRCGGNAARARNCQRFWVGRAIAGGILPAPRALTAIRIRTVDINVLTVIGVGGAVALGDQLEAVSVVFLFAVAQWLEVRSRTCPSRYCGKRCGCCERGEDALGLTVREEVGLHVIVNGRL